MRNKEKRAVVTGGAGFIGSHLAELLVDKGYTVIIIDDLSTGKMSNIETLLHKDNVEFVKGSISDLSLLQRLFQNVDYVFHEAAIASVARSIENPLGTHTVNVTGSLNVLLAARDNGVKKVVCASSAAVYGDTPTLPQREDMMPNPKSPYAVHKLTMEHYCRVFTELYSLPTVCLRYFNVYGPHQDPNSEYAAVIPKFIQRVLEGKPLTIFGDGEQSRDFVFVKDVAKANLLLAESDATGVFNIGTGESISLNTLAECILQLTGKNIEITHKEPRLGDIRESLADISKVESFGYRPEFSLSGGLKQMIHNGEKS